MPLRVGWVAFGLAVADQFKDLPNKVTQSTRRGDASQLGNSLDLDDYATQKTMDGLLTEIGAEEQSIRTHPGARIADLLKKVFGGE